MKSKKNFASMQEQLTQLAVDLGAYIDDVDQIFSLRMTKPEDSQRYFAQILISSSRLYLDSLLLNRDANTFPTKHIPSPTSVRDLAHNFVEREHDYRQRFEERLEQWPHWTLFVPNNPFSALTGLQTVQDYKNRLILHLPEIYVEAGRYHISFVLSTLEWASDESSWLDSH